MLFMEIVTEVIFTVSSTLSINDQEKDDLPEDELVEELIKTVTPSNGSTKPLSPLTDNEADKVPVVRSYLLQLLLDPEYVFACLCIFMFFIIITVIWQILKNSCILLTY